ncbi:MAG: hypothetical protein HQK57_12375 [Deltaproteobacteria bacterium]|nr:hypothetical protein [Deltaproteobacteria bacterium]MBF0524844.1 hypothetical protein [Deltaproteobacteria bacterium]
MATSFGHKVIVDTGFWIALFDPRDRRHDEAVVKKSVLSKLSIVLPWPCLYETLRTRFVKNLSGVKSLEEFLGRPNISLVDDDYYKKRAYELTIKGASKGRTISMIDMLIRLMLDDKELRITHLLTFNEKDFVDVCRIRQIELL